MFRELTLEEAQEFRRWARQNYKPGEPINDLWHPITREECHRMNIEAGLEQPT